MCCKNKFGINLLFLLPLIVLVIYWYIFSVDIPWYDDAMVLAFTRNWSISGLDHLIFKQLIVNYNEHIIFITKLIFWLNFKCLGYINLSYLAFQGLVFYLAFILLFIKHTSGKSWNVKLMSVFLLASLSYDEGYLWAMTSIQNFASLLFTFLAIIFLTKRKITFSFFFLCLGLLSSGQTLVFIPIWILGLLYLRDFNWKMAGLLLVVIIFYFSGYQKTGIQPDIKSIMYSFNTERIISIMTFFAPPFGSLGRSFTIAYFFIEFFLLLFVCYQIVLDFKYRQLTGKKIMLSSLLIWSSMIMFVTVVVRVEIESRYLIYSIIKTTCIYSYLMETSSQVKWTKVFVFMSVFFYLTSFYPSMLKAKNTHIAMSTLKFNLLKNKATYFYGTDDVDTRKKDPYYTALKSSEIIDIPNRLNGRIYRHLLLFNQMSNEQINSIHFNKELSPLIRRSFSKSKLIAKNIKVDSLSSFIVYQNKIVANDGFDTYYILLKSPKSTMLFNFKTDVPTLMQYVQSREFINQLIIYKNIVPYGQYDMYLLSCSKNSQQMENEHDE